MVLFLLGLSSSAEGTALCGLVLLLAFVAACRRRPAHSMDDTAAVLLPGVMREPASPFDEPDGRRASRNKATPFCGLGRRPCYRCSSSNRWGCTPFGGCATHPRRTATALPNPQPAAAIRAYLGGRLDNGPVGPALAGRGGRRDPVPSVRLLAAGRFAGDTVLRPRRQAGRMVTLGGSSHLTVLPPRGRIGQDSVRKPPMTTKLADAKGRVALGPHSPTRRSLSMRSIRRRRSG